MTGGTEVSLGLITSLFLVKLTCRTVVPSAQLVEQYVSAPGKLGLQDWTEEEVGRHLHGEVGDEGFLGQLYLEGRFLDSIGSVDHPAGDNSMSKSGRDPGVHREAVDIDAILDKGQGGGLGHLPDTRPPTLQE